jgi:hypothetical protein
MREVYKEKEKNRSATNFEMSSFWKITLRWNFHFRLNL